MPLCSNYLFILCSEYLSVFMYLFDCNSLISLRRISGAELCVWCITDMHRHRHIAILHVLCVHGFAMGSGFTQYDVESPGI